MTGILFAPILPWPTIAALAAVILLITGWALWRRARGTWLRLIPLLVLVLAVMNPRLAGERHLPLDDVAVVVVDDSASQSVGNRRNQTEDAAAAVVERMKRLPNLDVRVEHLRPDPATDEGTRLFSALDRAISDVPRRRLAGAVLITDGQVHDIPANPAKDIGAPVHMLLTGAKDESDRRLVIEKAPSFGLVGKTVKLSLRIDDPSAKGKGGTALLSLRRDGGTADSMELPLNESHEIEVPIDHGGQTVLELDAEAGTQELSLANNRAALAINGVRDRLRVLLISGEPHAGERTWRNLLKADPSVDLVHFTILRPPEKDDRTPLKELALISFPIRELFEEKLADFDLIIFDRYRRRSVLPLNYYQNIADYVRKGGALLMAVGPEFGEDISLYNTPLEEVLPAAPTKQVSVGGFLPGITELGRRHPVTAGLPGGDAAPPRWGRWLRFTPSQQLRGQAVMADPGGQPLLILDHVGQGRVAQLLSDTIWLWSRGYEGGGPHAELLRRLAHWLMKEPELEEFMLRAELRGSELHILRRSLDQGSAEVEITLPDNSKRKLTLADQGDGRATGSIGVDQPGLYRVTDGARTAIAAAGSLNPVETADLAATDSLLRPVAEATHGSVQWLAESGLPDLRRVEEGRAASGRGWIGLRSNGDHLVTAVSDQALLPGPLLLLLGFGGLILAWWREGR